MDGSRVFRDMTIQAQLRREVHRQLMTDHDKGFGHHYFEDTITIQRDTPNGRFELNYDVKANYEAFEGGRGETQYCIFEIKLELIAYNKIITSKL